MDDTRTPSLSEASARRAVLRGDRTAWEALYFAHQASIARAARQRLGGPAAGEELEEILQETWMVGVRRIRDFDPARGSFRAWMLGILGKVLLERGRARWRGAQQTLVEEPVAAEEPERSEEIEEALAGIDPVDRALLEGRYAEGRTVKELANSCGRTPKAIESALARARAALRTRVENLRSRTT